MVSAIAASTLSSSSAASCSTQPGCGNELATGRLACASGRSAAVQGHAPARRAALVDGQDDRGVTRFPGPPRRASTSRTCPAIDGPPGSCPSKIAPPMVKPQAPAWSRALIWATLATDPAAITGPLAARTTARVSSAASAVWCR